MRLYLAQHAHAVPKESDPERPLSDVGRADAARMGVFLAAAGVKVAHVFHSGKLRAQQTADILAPHVAPDVKPASIQGIGPKDPPKPILAKLQLWEGDTLLIGHLPFMDRLVSKLLTGHDEIETTAFKPGTIACVEQRTTETGDSTWVLLWMVPPALIRS